MTFYMNPRTAEQLKESIKELIERYEMQKGVRAKMKTEYVDKLRTQEIWVGSIIKIKDCSKLSSDNADDFKGENEVIKFYTSYVGIKNLKSGKSIKIRGYEVVKIR